MAITAPRGTVDITPDQIHEWQYIEREIRRIMEIYRYKEIRTPIFEKTELFIRGVGEGTDIVTKEMYTFEDKGGRSITLRPEGTASVVRSYIERGFHAQSALTKFYYMAPMFRYERPQAGRLRQHHQFGVEALGSPSPDVDVEVIALVMQLYNELGLKSLKLKLNSVGCAECRKVYLAKLNEFISTKVTTLCVDCQTRYEKNPLRILDCKNENCRTELAGSPEIVDYLCECCREHFDGVRAGLTRIGTPFVEDSRLVRGLDYYTRTTFEIVAEGIGAQDAIAGGGRYNSLVEQLGGPATPAVGFGAGIERLIATLKKAGVEIPVEKKTTVFFALLDNAAREIGQPIMYQCRGKGVHAEMDSFNRSLKAQLKLADKLNARYAVLIGENEIQQGRATVRDFQTKEQVDIAFSELTEYLLSRIETTETPNGQQPAAQTP